MTSYLLRRLLASVLILLGASFIVYMLIAYSGDPLQEYRTSNLPNREQLMQARIDLLHLDVPPVLRYFVWLGGAAKCVVPFAQCDLGTSINGQAVTAALQSAIPSTLQLVTGAAVLAITIGIVVGIVTALRQYSALDYSVTFIAFLFFSLPVFWVAVLLKEFGAIGFNDFLADPRFSTRHDRHRGIGVRRDLDGDPVRLLAQTRDHVRLGDRRDRRGHVLPVGERLVRLPRDRPGRPGGPRGRDRDRRDGDRRRACRTGPRSTPR